MVGISAEPSGYPFESEFGRFADKRRNTKWLSTMRIIRFTAQWNCSRQTASMRWPKRSRCPDRGKYPLPAAGGCPHQPSDCECCKRKGQLTRGVCCIAGPAPLSVRNGRPGACSGGAGYFAVSRRRWPNLGVIPKHLIAAAARSGRCARVWSIGLLTCGERSGATGSREQCVVSQ